MVKVIAFTSAVTLLASCALAAPTNYENSNLQERSPRFGSLLHFAHFGGHINDLSNQNQKRSIELEARSPGLGGLFKAVIHVGEHALGGSGGGGNQNHKRSLDEDDILLTREDLEEVFGREFVEDIEARSPFGLGSLFGGVKKMIGFRRTLDSIDGEVLERSDYDDLD